MNDKGYHYIIDMKVKEANILADSHLLKSVFQTALTNFKILKYGEYKFKTGGCGVTGFFLLAESHLSYHTYPENNYIAIDIFTCGKNPLEVVEIILQHFSPTTKFIILLQRGSESVHNVRAITREVNL